ncbi:hypothetical protein LTR17_005068 [Elasticomyces elasticus]|nr:hypothetical protein LTR17_005068 [Elasticomyces elasticus]
MAALRYVPLPHLREARISRFEQGFNKLVDILQLPALRVLRAGKARCDEYSTDALAMISAPLGVERIHLEDIDADTIGLGRLLAAAPGLKTLSVNWGSQGTHLLEFGTLGQTLCARGKNIESLRLVSTSLGLLLPNPGSHSSIGDLGELASMQHLALPHAVLCTSENADEWLGYPRDYLTRVLPRSLRSLDIGEAEPTQSREYAEHPNAVTMRNPLDLQLLELMTDRRYVYVRLITVHRDDNFTCPCDAAVLGWVEKPGNGSFTLQKRSEETS